MDKRLTLYVSSPDSYADVFSVFLKGFHKYWPNCPYDFLLTTNTKSYEGINCICNQKANDNWVERTIEALPQIKTKYILLMCDDLIINKQVDNLLIEKILDYMDEHDIMYCRLRPLNYGDIIKEMPILRRVNKQTPYAVNLQIGIFRKIYLEELLGDGNNSAWDIENRINEEAEIASNENFEKIISTSQPVISFVHGVYKGKWVRSSVYSLKKMGFWEDRTSRGTAPISIDIKKFFIGFFSRKLPLSFRRFTKKILSTLGYKFVTKY